ncbi:Oligopeptide transport system permease protein OppC [Clavibacter michiganensis]|uniref:Oligopeptide transport system permease protein OppC n=1 Tax=Clavibacter michiganensis TaxID=28447 RepID=A0A251YNZ5_9MICO|nr:ABC transporter permease [Clavibacter michiganensis]OUE25889.1 Oligopeptide transport system permease protein OppC [Clavibacter michiganensis]
MTNSLMGNPNDPHNDPHLPEGGANSELTIEQREVEGLSQGTVVRRRFLRHKGAMTSVVVLLLMAILVYSSVGIQFFGLRIPGWWMWGYEDASPIVNGGNPTWDLPFQFGAHPFGQDEIGRDIFARVMRGTQQSIVVMVVYGVIAAFLGIVVGAVSGFFRGRIDSLLMRFTDLIIVIPVIVIAAVLGRTFGSLGAAVLGIVLGLVGWPSLARLVRGEFLSLREREFVDAARVAGASNSRIVFRHILPNAIGVVIVSTTLLMSAAILLEAALSFLGFGIRKPDVSLGQIINEYQGAFATRPWLFWFPGLFIIIIALTINFIGDGLRDAFDPRQRRMPGGQGPYKQMFAMLTGRTRREQQGPTTGSGAEGVRVPPPVGSARPDAQADGPADGTSPDGTDGR